MKKLIILIFAIMIWFSSITNVVHASASSKFKDVQSGDWFYSQVLVLVDKGIVGGYPDGTFKPQNNISVDEFIKILVTSLGHKLNASKEQYWAEPFISKAEELGIITQGEFQDYRRPVTRGEMARMIVRAKEEVYPENIIEYIWLIKDYDSMNEEQKDIALKIFVSGIISGYPNGTFGFNNNATRAEAAVILNRFLYKEQRKTPVHPASDQSTYQQVMDILTKMTDEIIEKSINNSSGSIQIPNYTNNGQTMTQVSSSTFIYPLEGREMELGPYYTYYIEITKSSDGKFAYINILREIDDFIIYRKYSDGKEEVFDAPTLTAEQIEDFLDKYDWNRVQDRLKKEAEEFQNKATESANEREEELMRNNQVSKGDNFTILKYLIPSEDIIFHMRELGIADIYFSDVSDKAFIPEDVNSSEKIIIDHLSEAKIDKHITVIFAPFKSEKYKQGHMYTNMERENGVVIVLFNNDISLLKQFEYHMNNLE